MSRVWAVVMAGGSGERFWPLSRQDHPKQFLRLPGGTQSLLLDAVERSRTVASPGQAVVCTSRRLREKTVSAVGDLAHVWAEPANRNTGGCVLWSMAQPDVRPDDVVLFLPADHGIDSLVQFRADADAAVHAALSTHALVTIGVTPTRPDTGYGYIQVEGETAPFRVRRFHEKPHRDLAQAYVTSGDTLWNAGIFVWTRASFEEALEAVDPAVARSYQEMGRALATGDTVLAESYFVALPNLSIDYLLMERAPDVWCVPAGFGWDDVGTWSAYARYLPTDERENATIGETLIVRGADNTVVNNSTTQKTVIANAYGLLVVVTEDTIFIADKDASDTIRAVVAQLRSEGDPRV